MRIKNIYILYIGLGALLLLAVPLYFIYDPNIPGKFPSCPFLSITGLYCTGCGSQRALHDLLHLDIAGVVKHNLLFLPAIIFSGYHIATKVLGKLNDKSYFSPVYHTKTPRLIMVLVLLFTALRNIDVFPFTALAP